MTTPIATETAETESATAEPRSLWQKLVLTGFWFFLIKGLLWLAAPLIYLILR